jgi:hypothetical protein
MTNHIHPDDRRMILVWLLVCLAIVAWFCSCSPAKKAHEYFAGHQKEFAQDCADAYPVVPIIDRKDFDKSLETIITLTDQLQADSIRDQQDAEWNRAEIDRLKKIAPADCDSLSVAFYRYVMKEKSRGDSLEKKAKQIAGAAKTVKPIIETKVDAAALQACANREDVLRKELAEASSALVKAAIKQSEIQAERDEWKAAAKKRWWLIVALIAVIAAIILRKPILNIAKSIFMKTLIPIFTIIFLSALASCGHFHDDPKVSVWSDCVWIIPTLIFGGAAIFTWKAIKAHNSGSNLIDSGATTNKEGGKVPYSAVSWTKWAVGLLIVGLIIVCFVNSKCNR